jgi:hypothetical protein
MSWQTELLATLRMMVGDWNDAAPIYSDDTLLKMLAIGAKHVSASGLTFGNIFSASVDAQTIVPDPTVGDTRDDSFANLVTIKAASIIDRAEAGIAAKRAILVKDGASLIDLTGPAKAKIALLAKGGWSAVYDEEKFEYQNSGLGSVAGAAVLGPFRLYPNYSGHGVMFGNTLNNNNYIL